MKDDVGIKIATHGWIGSEITGGKFMLEDGAEMQWKEEREVSLYLMVFISPPLLYIQLPLLRMNYNCLAHFTLPCS